MLRQIKNYNLKKLLPMAMIAVMPTFTACEKDDFDPAAEAKKEMNIAANEFRASIAPARETIEPFFETEESLAKYHMYTPTNLKDSCYIYINVADRLWDSHGNPLPRNHDNVQNMHTTANTCLAKIAAYENALGR